jgi:hypothetical protein
VDELHGNEGHPVGFVDLIDYGNIGMLESGRRLGLLNEPALPLRVGNQLGRQDLEGDLAVQIDVEGTVDDPHAATADLIEDLVMGEGLADHPGTPLRGLG